jgi:hypothetical protein
MGVASPLFTHRMDATTNALLQQVGDRTGYAARHVAPQAAQPTQHELALHSVKFERRAQP